MPKSLPQIIRLTPTPEDWWNGAAGSVTQCTLAQAAKRLLPGLAYVSFKQNGATFTFDDKYWHYALDNRALKIIACTDATKPKSQERYLYLQPFVGKSVTLRLINVVKSKPLPAQKRAAKVAKERGKPRASQSRPLRVQIAKAHVS